MRGSECLSTVPLFRFGLLTVGSFLRRHRCAGVVRCLGAHMTYEHKLPINPTPPRVFRFAGDPAKARRSYEPHGCSNWAQFVPFLHIHIMMKLSDIIQRLQQVRAQHPDAAFYVEATGRAEDDGEICTVIGNDFVRLDVEMDSDGYYATLVTETKR